MNADAYLDRIGATHPARPAASGLRDLHGRHLLAVPFENLSIHLGEPISLVAEDLLDKIVRQRRGGFCYELNGAFALLLEALGFAVTRAAARVHSGEGYGPLFDHLALIVDAGDGTGRWLADVGFGNHSVYPLHLDTRDEQRDPGGRFMLRDAPDRDIDVYKDGEPQYRLECRERTLDDFVPTCWWQQTWPGSHFRQSTICSRLTESGRISLSGRTLIRTDGGLRTETPLAGDAAVLNAYREHFGIVLDRVPVVQ